MFKVPISGHDYTISPDWLVLNNCCNMRHDITINPHDNFLFSVHLPNGQLLETVANDTIVPDEPQPSLQISATFQITFTGC